MMESNECNDMESSNKWRVQLSNLCDAFFTLLSHSQQHTIVLLTGHPVVYYTLRPKTLQTKKVREETARWVEIKSINKSYESQFFVSIIFYADKTKHIIMHKTF